MKTLTLLLLLLTFPSLALAHGVPDMCDMREDLIAQCGEFHTCRTRPEVSDDIGVCEGEFEEERFISCDRRRGDDDCEPDFVCRIGNIDPNIGACLKAPPRTYLDPEPDMGAIEPVEPDPGPACAHAPGEPSSAPGALFGLLGLALGWRRRRT